MEQHDIHELIKHPERLDGSTLLYLKEMVARYPYFQTAWVLYLKNLFIQGDPSFKEELKRGALFVADLSVLFYYIEGERFLIKKHETIGEAAGGGTDRTLDLIDRFLSELPEQAPQPKTVSDMSIPMEMPGDYTSVLLSEVGSEAEDSSPLHGQELIDQFLEETQSGGPELQPAFGTGDEDSAETTEVQRDETAESPQTAEATEPATSAKVEEDSEESYFTETLAKIYVRQQRYDKALEIIKKLNLKYPKKNAYFADQIRFLEKLIINAKSK